MASSERPASRSTGQHNPVVFLSYTQFDDEYDQGALSRLRNQLERALRFANGTAIDIFQDTEHIKLGQSIHTRIEQSLGEAMIFIPILTPSYFKSIWCRDEFERFLQRERHQGRADLIIPVYYQTVRALEQARTSAYSAQSASDPLVREVAPRLAIDWHALRALGPESTEVRAAVERMAARIIEVLEELQTASPPPDMPEDEDPPATAPGTSTSGSEDTSNRLRGVVVGSSSGQVATTDQISGNQRSPATPTDQPGDMADMTPEQSRLLAILSDPRQNVQARIKAGDALGRLGDPRFPVEIRQWQRELARRSEQFGTPANYFCYVRPGTYQIGGWRENQASADITLPAFWIARFPITVAQYAPFVREGYRSERWWTAMGSEWKKRDLPWRWRERRQPWRWNESPFDGPNQPVIGIAWYEARAFCAWLTEQLRDALPDGYVIRLPTEAEWEVAVAYDAQRQRRSYPWGEEAPTAEHAIFKDDQGTSPGRPAPVGCCPVGAAACGALDMAGNVWEVTTSSHGGYPAQSGSIKKDFTPGEGDVPWRGGSRWSNRTDARCGARYMALPDHVIYLAYGFRVVAAPRIAHMF